MKNIFRRLVLKTALLFFVVPLFLVATSQAASLDCGKASTKIEKMICADAELSRFDKQLNKQYKDVLNKAVDPKALKQRQHEWLKDRNRCADADCIREHYWQRLALLDQPEYINNVPMVSVDCQHAKSGIERYSCGKSVETSAGNENFLVETELQNKANPDAFSEAGTARQQWLIKELHAVYKEALTKHFDPALLRREQLAWFEARERCLREDGCYADGLYMDRIENLRYNLFHPPQTKDERKYSRLLSMGSPSGNNFVISDQPTEKGFGYDLCEALVRWLNYTTPEGDTPKNTIATVVGMPGVSEPAWQELDIRQHIELFEKIVMYHNTHGRTGPPSPWVQKSIEDARNGKYRIWSVRIKGCGNKPLTVVGFTHIDQELSLEKYYRLRVNVITPVKEDLSDVDSDTSLHAVGLLFYKNKPLFLSGTGGSLDARCAPSCTYCPIDNFKHNRSEP